MARGQHTYHEIQTQPDTWARALEGFAARESEVREAWVALAPRQVVFTGCGSTYYLSQSASALFQALTGVPAQASPGSQLALLGLDVVPDPRHTLLIAVSRSGTTSETLMAVDRFHELGGRSIWAITCSPGSALAQSAGLALVAEAAQEKSVAQTRSFTSMLLLAMAVTAVAASDGAMLERLRRLPAALRDLAPRVGELPGRLGADLTIERIFFLGNGPLYGVASEAMLKTKEVSLSHAEAFYPLEFRHGPMSMVNEHTLIVALLSDRAVTEEVHVLRDMQALGARILALVEDADRLGTWRPDQLVEVHGGMGEWERGLLYLPVLQQLAYFRGLAKGLDPDRPHNLTAVVIL